MFGAIHGGYTLPGVRTPRPELLKGVLGVGSEAAPMVVEGMD